MFEKLREKFDQIAPQDGFVSLRAMRIFDEQLSVRRGVTEPPHRREDVGAMVTVHRGGGMGYASTADLSTTGLRDAVARATQWAERSAAHSLINFREVSMPHPKGEYQSPTETNWSSVPLSEKLSRLQLWSKSLKTDAKIIDWSAKLWGTREQSLYLTNGGGEVWQQIDYVVPDMSVAANDGSDTTTRSIAGSGLCQQGGWENLDAMLTDEIIAQLPAQALELLCAPQCPSGAMDVVLAPDQMVLQVHESIGHPLELDRILGDERNYAGTTFVTPDMFGSYEYGSELLNITFDPTVIRQFASYGFDHEGTTAEREFIIKNGILKRPLGGTISQARAQMPGVANARAQSWNRPPIDRMANLNLEPGNLTDKELIGQVEHGVYMETNISWSIDDSRNKFQFGCEYGRRIRDGQLAEVVRNPNYRGISATFWRSLAGVGDHESFRLLGTPFCGKGEPNQVMRVGHAVPACLFRNVDVFGGAS